jgi:hypothetical protein
MVSKAGFKEEWAKNHDFSFPVDEGSRLPRIVNTYLAN